MPNLYDELVERSGSNPVLVYGKETLSLRDFLKLVDDTVQALRRAGVERNDAILIGALDKPRFLAAFYACFRIGAAAVPIDTSNPEAVKAAAHDTAASAVLDREGCKSLSFIDSGTQSLSPMSAIVMSTSGTTGVGKRVIIGHESIGHTARFMNEAMGVDESIREYVLAPLDHAFAFGRCHAVLCVGGTLLMDPGQRNFRRLFTWIEEERCNALSVVPAVLASLVRLAADELLARGEALRWVQTGAMRLDMSYRQKLCESLPGAGVFLHYGLSEAMRTTFFDLNAHPEKIHTEGPAAYGVEIGIFDEKGQALSPGHEGRIRIRGANLALGYTDASLWSESRVGDWFVTSDVGMLDEEGFLEFRGRHDDVINTNGYMVHPTEVESRLNGILSDQSFCVVGKRDPFGIKDKVIVLCVEGSSDIDLHEVKGFFTAAESYMVPHEIHEFAEFPRTRTGKVMRNKVIELLEREKRP